MGRCIGSRRGWLALAAAVGLAAWPQLAPAKVDAMEPGSCDPACRKGFFCKQAKCVSQCNPPCDRGDRCVEGECLPQPRKGAPHRRSYVGVLGAYFAPLNDSAQDAGEVRLELGGPYVSLQLGPVFGDAVTALRTAILGHIPFQPLDPWLFYIEPTISLGYAFGWLDDGQDGHQQDIFLALGLRLRYDVHPRLAVLLELIGVQINFVQLYDNKVQEVHRQDVVPVTWNLALGLAFLY